MKASQLRPGQFFEFEQDEFLCVYTYKTEIVCVDSYAEKYKIDPNDEVFLIECWDDWAPTSDDKPTAEVPPLDVTGWDDEPEYELIAIGDKLQEGDLVSFGASPDRRPIDEGYGTVILTQDYAKFWRRKAIAEVPPPAVEDECDADPVCDDGYRWLMRGELIEAADEHYYGEWQAVESGWVGKKYRERHVWIRRKIETPPAVEEPPPFKAGDWVVCVSSAFYGHAAYGELRITEGCLYRLVHQKEDRWKVDDGSEVYWYSFRFRHATPEELRRHWLAKMGLTQAEIDHDCKVDPPVDVAIEADEARAIERVTKLNAAKPDSDGWIEHDGGKMPVWLDRRAMLEVELNEPSHESPLRGEAGSFYWTLRKDAQAAIKRYRLVQPANPITDWVEVVTR